MNILQNASLNGLLTTVSPGGRRGNLSVMLFHKVPKAADPLVPGELLLSSFDSILDFFQANATVISLTEGIAALAAGKLPPRAVAITFDDGYAEWMQNVAPALIKRGFPATFFVTTEVLDGTVLWHERIVAAVRALPVTGSRLPYGFAGQTDLTEPRVRANVIRVLQDRLKYLPLNERLATIASLEAQAVSPLQRPTNFTAGDVRALHSLGFDIGAHTTQHPILNECNDSEALREIGGSKEVLEAVIGGKVGLFAYPNGRPGLDYRAKHVAMAKRCGYTGAVASSGGIASEHTDIFQIPRTTTWGNSHVHMAYHLARNKFTKEKSILNTDRSAEPETDVRCLMIASTFAPIHGGSAVVYESLCKHMPKGSIRVLAASENYLTHKPIPGWQAHDQTAHYPVDRLPLLRPLMLPPPANTLVSVYRLVLQDLPLYARNLWTAARIVSKHRINVICVGELVTGSWLGFALKRLFGCKVIIYVHGEEVTTQTGGRLHGNRRASYLRKADKVVAVSSFTCDALTNDMAVAANSLALIQNGVDTDRFMPGPVDKNFLARHGLTNQKIVLTVGRLVPRKGIDMAIRAMRQVVNQMPEVRHLIVGEGEYRPELERIITEEQLSAYVTLVGKTSDRDLLNYLRCCDVFLMPNRTMPDGDTEGFGLVFREANACGKPVIGGRAGGAVEAVIDGQTGVLVDGNNIDEIASAVTKFLKDPELAQKMGLNGLKLAQDNSTVSVSKRFLKTCERVIVN